MKKFSEILSVLLGVSLLFSSCGKSETVYYYSDIDGNTEFADVQAEEFVPFTTFELRSATTSVSVTTTAVTTETQTTTAPERNIFDRTAPEGYEIPEKCTVDMKTVMQRPELPTGCEITSLAQTLNFWGFNIDKTELCDKFMLISTDGYYAMNKAYVGDPHTEYGYGCDASVIAQTANDYFTYIGSEWKAHDLTGADFKDLYYQMSKGRPVIIWMTIGLIESQPELQFTTRSGDDLVFTNLQHCVTIYGYDKSRDVIYTADPLAGNVEYNATQFERVYNIMGKQAVVISGNATTAGKDNTTPEQKEQFLKDLNTRWEQATATTAVNTTTTTAPTVTETAPVTVTETVTTAVPVTGTVAVTAGVQTKLTAGNTVINTNTNTSAVTRVVSDD